MALEKQQSIKDQKKVITKNNPIWIKFKDINLIIHIRLNSSN